MDTIFTLDDDTDGDLRVNLDDLYERKKKHDLNTLATYKKILARIHNRINTISRQQMNHQFCWFLVPEMIIGVPNYDHGACVAYCIDELKNNGFLVRYTHPNLLLISWQHWIPSYVRNEIKKKTGVNVDGYGNKIIKSEVTNESNKSEPSNPNSLLFQRSKVVSVGAKKDYKELSSYKPSGKLIYNNELLKNIEDISKK
jgi:hypothetical protein